MKKAILKYAAIILMLIYSIPAFAGPNDPDAEDDPSVPIDMWLIILPIIALAIAVYYYRKNYKLENTGL